MRQNVLFDRWITWFYVMAIMIGCIWHTCTRCIIGKPSEIFRNVSRCHNSRVLECIIDCHNCVFTDSSMFFHTRVTSRKSAEAAWPILLSLYVSKQRLSLMVELRYVNPWYELTDVKFVYSPMGPVFCPIMSVFFRLMVSPKPFKEGLYRIQILCRRHPFWSYLAGLTIADPPG